MITRIFIPLLLACTLFGGPAQAKANESSSQKAALVDKLLNLRDTTRIQEWRETMLERMIEQSGRALRNGQSLSPEGDDTAQFNLIIEEVFEQHLNHGDLLNDRREAIAATHTTDDLAQLIKLYRRTSSAKAKAEIAALESVEVSQRIQQVRLEEETLATLHVQLSGKFQVLGVSHDGGWVYGVASRSTPSAN